jgi:hypothetical protein
MRLISAESGVRVSAPPPWDRQAQAAEKSMSPIELAIIIIGSLGEFAGLAFIAFQVRQTNRDVQYVAALQAAVLLRTDRTDKTVADIKTMLQK